MKKILSNLMLVAAAAMAFSACQKTEMVEPETSQEVMLTFASEKPAFDDETKTEWTGETIQWSAGDKIAIAYTVAGKWQNASGDASGDAKLYKSDALEAATETAQFNVSASFKGTTEGTHVFYGVYPAPSSTSFDDAPVATLTVPSIQTPGVASFDGSADLMTGVSVGEFTSLPTEPISMKWTRLVAHANITLKALNGVTAGETVSSITLTAQEGANLVGSQKVDITANTVVNNNNESNVLELNGGNLSIDASGNIEFWACVLPETLTSLAVVVETNKATYTREITGISKTFKQNARNTLSIKMNEATRVAKEEESWVLVTPADSLTEGTYVLVVSTDTKTGALISTNGTSAAPTFNTSISVSDNTLNGVTEAMQFDLSGTTGNYKLAVTGQTTDYLYTTDGNNGVRVGTNTNNVWTITQHESNADAFVFKCNATSRYLGVYNNTDWRCYTAFDAGNFTNGSGSSQIYLYKKQSGPVVPDTTPKIIVEDTEYGVDADDETLEFSYTTKNIDGTPAVSVADGATMKNVEAEAAEGIVTVKFDANAEDVEKTATLVLSYEGAESVYVTITQAAKAAAGGESGWISTSFADLKEGDQVVIVSTKNTDTWAMSNDKGTGSAPAGVTGVTYSNGKLTVDPAENIIWYVGVDGNNRIFYKDSGKTTWLYCTATNNGVRVGTNAAKTFTFEETSGYLTHIGTKRYIGVYTTTPDWRCYTTIHSNIQNQTFQFFVKTGEGGGETPVDPVQLTMSEITCSAQTENSLTFNWTAVANATGYEVTCNNKTETVHDVTYTATGLTASTQYTISVKAVGDGINYTTSEAKTQTGTTAAAQGGGDEGGETTGGYTLVTSLSDITTGQYVIAAKVGTSYYAMSNTFSTKIDGTSITVNNDVISVSDAENYIVEITKTSSGYTIYSGTKYLGYGTSGTNFTTPTSEYTWKISEGTLGTFRISATTGSNRGLIYRTSTYNQFGGYSTTNVKETGNEYFDVELFKLAN